MRDLTGKVAFITGGASGIGFGMAKAFSAAGMSVVIADIRQDHLDTAMKSLAGARVHPIRLDVTDRKAMALAADETERVFGKVHIVCNNAGINQFNDIGTATLSANATPTDPKFLESLAQVHQVGMTPEEIGGKVLRAIQRNDFYIFSHPEFKDELRAIFDEALNAIPEEPAPPARLAFEEGRRERNAKARAGWPQL